MHIKIKKIQKKELLQHETKLHVFIKFIVFIIIIIGYFFYVSQKYGVQNGLFVTFLTWSFFVIGTPVADAGFIIDFPMRIFFHIKMIYSELFVWGIALSLNFYALSFSPEIYEHTELLSFLKKILLNPFPFWGIILLSALGTFLSVYFGDELINKTTHEERSFYHKYKYNYRFIVMIFIFAISFTLYGFLLKKLGIQSLF